MNRLTVALLAFALAACSEPPLIPADSGAPDDAGSPDSGTDAGTDAGPGYAVFYDEGMGPETAEQFQTASPSPVEAPEIVYPESGTLVPPNMVGVDIHFRAAVVQAFEVTFSQGGEPSVVAYIRCAPVADGCVFQPWREVWAELAARRSAGPYEITIRGLAGDGVTAASRPIELELASEAITGGVYYYASDDAPPSIRRYELGLERRSSEVYLELPGVASSHVISRDGARLAVFTAEIDGGTVIETYDVATRTPIGEPIRSEIGLLPRFGPGHDMLLSAPLADIGWSQPIQIVSGTDGSVLQEWNFGAAHSADWAPSGDRIAFNITVGLDGFRFIMDLNVIDRVDGVWQEPRVIPIPDTNGALSPSFAPDSDWIGFTADDKNDRDEYGTYRHMLVALRVSDGRVVQLNEALGDVDRYEGRPSNLRWNPSPYMHDGRRIFWFTYSTGRSCGLLPRIEEPAIQGDQIWMAAFDPEADPDDPSRPAFRLPAQRWGLRNSLAEWALEVRRQPCETDDECPDGQVCLDGFCFEAPE